MTARSLVESHFECARTRLFISRAVLMMRTGLSFRVLWGLSFVRGDSSGLSYRGCAAGTPLLVWLCKVIHSHAQAFLFLHHLHFALSRLLSTYSFNPSTIFTSQVHITPSLQNTWQAIETALSWQRTHNKLLAFLRNHTKIMISTPPT